MNEVLGAIVTITKIGQDGRIALKGGSCNAIIADRGIRASHFNCHLALQNPIPVGVTFLIWRFEGSLALVLISTFALGVIVSLLISIPAIVKRRSTISKSDEENNRARE